jgi:hypothetical protein
MFARSLAECMNPLPRFRHRSGLQRNQWHSRLTMRNQVSLHAAPTLYVALWSAGRSTSAAHISETTRADLI